ncbi:PA3371 family protein [Pseudomonas sp. zbq_18]|uniref:PA3371 family protein n=1 Tax=Pseudomonadota TaxID=1224 RepID=UPI00370C8462
MSTSAVCMLITTLLSLAVLWLYPPLAPLIKWVAGIAAVAFVLALAAGRRYKFDPILR